MSPKHRMIANVLISLLTSLELCAQPLFSCEGFISPDAKWRPIPLWFWNNSAIKESEMMEQFQHMVDTDLYGGC
ncbi:MAG: hypothetical protein ACI4UA_06375, partial [Bacteroidaceae bacterium]